MSHNEVTMSDINKEEMFGNLKNFLKTKGIEIQDGSYADGIRKGCEILTDTVNMSQRAFDRAKVVVDKGLDSARQTVHEYTAPKEKAASGAKTTASGASETRTKSSAGKGKSAKTKTTSSARGKKRGK
jgi:hypothetical protein